MKDRLRIFELTKRDQRAAIVIMIILLLMAVGGRYWERRSQVAKPTITIPQATPPDDRAKPNESP